MKTEYQMQIIYRIRQLREEYGYAQGKLAAVIGVSNGQIGNIESNRTSHKYTLAHILRICQEFHFPIEQLFLDESDYERDESIVTLLVEKLVRYEQS